MRKLIRHRHLEWLPTVVVLIVVLLAGSRLMYLSVRHHAAVAHETAATVAANFAGKIEPALQRLAALADRQAASAGSESAAPATNTFLMTAEDKVLTSRQAELATADGLAREWHSAESTRPAPGPSVLGPIRLGSKWLVAARFPLPQARGWSVAYADLEDLIASSHLGRLVDMGYDFELSQVEPRSARWRVFISSSAEPLTGAVGARIHLPTTVVLPESYLEVTIRPRAGWYPAPLLASEIALLAFLAWALAFGTHD